MTGECYFFERKITPAACLGAKKSSFFEVKQTDVLCPLRHIFSVASEHNIYANIQIYDFPIGMDFDLENSKMWKKLFDHNKKMQTFNQGPPTDNVQLRVPLTAMPKKITDTRRLAN